MAQACDGYTKGSLMGNWYEERLAPNQAFRDDLGSKTTRTIDASISFPSDTNQLIPLARVSRNHAWDTQGIVADDGFKEYRSLTSTNFDQANLDHYFGKGDCRNLRKENKERNIYPENNPNNIQTFAKHDYLQLNARNVINLDKPRPVDRNVTDFGSTFNRHVDDHRKLYGTSTYQKSFQKPQFEMPCNEKNQLEILKEYYSGTNERPIEYQCIKMTSIVTGEKYKNMEDPKDNTGIQRSWLHNKDKGCVFAEDNLKKNTAMNTLNNTQVFDPLSTYKRNTSQRFDKDIETSLPIGDGVSKYPEDPKNGHFRKKRCDITIVQNQPLSKK